MSTVQLAGNGFGGLVQGNFGNYQAAADGTFTVDNRDAPALLTQGLSYVKQTSRSYTAPLAPAAATIGAVVASGALSNGSVSHNGSARCHAACDVRSRHWDNGNHCRHSNDHLRWQRWSDRYRRVFVGLCFELGCDTDVITRCSEYNVSYDRRPRRWHVTMASYEHNGSSISARGRRCCRFRRHARI